MLNIEYKNVITFALNFLDLIISEMYDDFCCIYNLMSIYLSFLRRWFRMAEMESSVSISITSAIVYVFSGLVFFLLVFLLVMMGVTNCNWECEGGSVFGDVEQKKEDDGAEK